MLKLTPNFANFHVFVLMTLAIFPAVYHDYFKLLASSKDLPVCYVQLTIMKYQAFNFLKHSRFCVLSMLIDL